MVVESILLLLLVAFIIGIIPIWPYSRPWGYTPMSVLTLLLVVFVIWFIADDRPFFRSSGQNLKSAVQDAGQDIKAAGRDVGDSIRRTVR